MTILCWFSPDRKSGKARCTTPGCGQWFDISADQINGNTGMKCPAGHSIPAIDLTKEGSVVETLPESAGPIVAAPAPPVAPPSGPAAG